MQEIFEKIIEKLEELQNYACFPTEWVNEEQSKIHSYYANKLTEILKLTEQYNNGWIPCSERLPEENSSVIVCFVHGAVTELAFYGGLFHGIYDYNTNVIIAWQPLPLPFRDKE